MQRLYEEHAEFGGVRVALRNSGTVSTRIADTILLNGKPIEDSYVDFVESDWDARGVVWYRIRPRLLALGQAAQIYVRFRRRPEGENATVTINLVNGKPVEVNVPYNDPGVTIDYVTVGKSADDLYVYARRAGIADPGNVAALTLDGAPTCFYACLEAIGGRPLPAEYRQNVVQAIGAGMNETASMTLLHYEGEDVTHHDPFLCWTRPESGQWDCEAQASPVL